MKKNQNDKLLDKLSFGLDSGVVSHNEYTGLIPFGPVDEETMGSYKRMKTFSPDEIVQSGTKHR
ncbi:MAG TPA: hypothetical protein IAA61_05765 [Candidatus Ornithomonoglobus merdipullorum]|uniref:Uncharacterized protein n=1 Tax=Candidatus Ornithomonoglobus merdipullorum TaxID=2840895 RepID=A0A9D1MBM0_9FIRM|nr:hypothetical protein [Candidatus Ornithomonoglobus merdipullorum]